MARVVTPSTAPPDPGGAVPHGPARLAGPGRADLSHMARGGMLNLAGSVVNAGSAFAVVVAITRGLGKGPAGAFLVAVALFQIMATAGQMGADTGVLRFIPASLTKGRPGQVRGWLRVAVVPVLVVGVVASVAAIAGARPLADLVADEAYRDEFVSVFRVLAAFAPLVAAYSVLQAATRSFATMVPTVAVERIGRAGTQLVAVVVAIALDASTTVVALAWVLPFALAVVPLAAWFGRLERAAIAAVTPADTPDDTAGTSARRFWTFATPRAVAGIFQTAVLYLDVLLVGALASSAEAGVYAASGRWLVAGLFVTLAVNQAFQPQISALLAAADLDGARTLFQTATSWIVAFVWPVYLTVGLFGGVLVQVFGSGFDDGAAILAVLAVGGMIGSGSGPVDMVLLMGGRTRYNLLNTAVALVVNVIANLLLIPHLGAVGAAVSWSLSIAVANAMALVQVHRTVGIHPFGAGWLRIAPTVLVIVGGGLAVARVVFGPTLAGMLAGVAGAGVLYLLALRRLAPVLDAASLRRALRPRERKPA